MSDFLALWRSGVRPGDGSPLRSVADRFREGMLNLALFGKVGYNKVMFKGIVSIQLGQNIIEVQQSPEGTYTSSCAGYKSQETNTLGLTVGMAVLDVLGVK